VMMINGRALDWDREYVVMEYYSEI
jgi:hypothetical protein